MNNYKLIEKALIYIAENYKNKPSLEQISKHIGFSESHFQKLFSNWAGISPKKFLSYININYAKAVLKKDSVTLTTYKTGLSSTSRLHDLFVTIEAMTPAEYKAKGKNLAINYSFGESKFGEYLVASTNKGICEVIFDKKVSALNELFKKWANAKIKEGEDVNHLLIKDFLSNKDLFDQKIHLHLKGTNFQIKIWEALLKIPEGNLSTYAHIANSINSKAHRAVGTAIANNHIAYLIPCHRVIKSTGEIGNYRWGKEKKVAMIGLEADKFLANN